MTIEETGFENLFVIKQTLFTDSRGGFFKPFNYNDFKSYNLNANFKECFFTTSNKNAIRGMHYQSGEYAHDKLVFLIQGEILDVVLDLRPHSKNFGKSFSIKLSVGSNQCLYIGKGLAHGFMALTDNATVGYLCSTVQNKDYEKGVRWNTFGFNWCIETPIMSERDKDLPIFDFNNKYF